MKKELAVNSHEIQRQIWWWEGDLETYTDGLDEKWQTVGSKWN